MDSIVNEEQIDTSYEPFSREPEYIEANRAFVESLPLGPAPTVLDLACGTLSMTDQLLDRLESQPAGQPRAGTPLVFGLDLSRESLTLGRQFLVDKRSPHVLQQILLVEGTATSLPYPSDFFDAVMMGNAIQLVPDLDAMVREIHRVLRPGGAFGFNTSFYAGTYCPGTEHVYIRWVQESLDYVLRRDRELRAQGQPGIKRQRGTAGRAFSKPWLSTADYASSLHAAGLGVSAVNERTVMLTRSSFEKIGAYASLAKVLLSGYPVKLACEAMERAAGPTLEAVGMVEVPRYWLEMTAIKPVR